MAGTHFAQSCFSVGRAFFYWHILRPTQYFLFAIYSGNNGVRSLTHAGKMRQALVQHSESRPASSHSKWYDLFYSAKRQGFFLLFCPTFSTYFYLYIGLHFWWFLFSSCGGAVGYFLLPYREIHWTVYLCEKKVWSIAFILCFLYYQVAVLNLTIQYIKTLFFSHNSILRSIW